MKRLLLIPIFFLIILSCKNDKDTTTPQSFFANADEKWLLTEIEQTVNGRKVWVPVPALQPAYLIFRYDGVILNEEGKAGCCSPTVLTINNRPFEIKPQESILYESNCDLVLCGSCPVWDIEMTGNEMIISQCQLPRSKYERK